MKTTNNAQIEEVYYTPKETAKLIRTALKSRFPNQKFSVTSRGSIDISWTDGVKKSDVEEVINPFKTTGFDGMTDSNTYDPKLNVNESGQLVKIQYGYCFKFANRHFSDEIFKIALDDYCHQFAIVNEDNYNQYFNNRLLWPEVNWTLSQTDLTNGYNKQEFLKNIR